MTTLDPRPPHMPWLIPYLVVKDVAKATDFYERAFGFARLESAQGEDGQIYHAEMRYQDMVIMMGAEGAFDSPYKTPNTTGVLSPIVLYFYCKDVDHLFEQAVAAGAKVQSAPQDAFWGDRYCSVIDIDGYVWSFGKHLGSA